MYIRRKTTARGAYHYLCVCVREGRRIRQKVLCYLGAFDNVEDAFANAVGKRRAKLARYRDPADVEQLIRFCDR